MSGIFYLFAFIHLFIPLPHFKKDLRHCQLRLKVFAK